MIVLVNSLFNCTNYVVRLLQVFIFDKRIVVNYQTFLLFYLFSEDNVLKNT